jgi:uncharacterized protein
MRKHTLVEFATNHPRLIVAVTLFITALFCTQFPRITLDTNPKNMLPPDSAVRVWNDQIDQTFRLYEDTIVVAVQNSEGVINPKTLGNIHQVTEKILTIEGVAARDLVSFNTIDHIGAGAEGLDVAPLMAVPPTSPAELSALRDKLVGNPLFTDRIISKDETMAAIYIPLEKGANGKLIADQIKTIIAAQDKGDNFYVAGDPVVRDTFGAEMFTMMGLFAPIAGMIMFIAILWMFKSLPLAMAMMAVAMVSILCSMGLLIGLGFSVHIMSSMAPVFLMAIATDSIHIFNEFYHRYRKGDNKQQAIHDTLDAVSRPVRFTAFATAAGFAVLLFMQIIPVQIFGGVIVFGTLLLRLLSFTLIPALLMLMDENKILAAVARENATQQNSKSWLLRFASAGVNHPKKIIALGALAVGISVIGMTQININNNLVEWFTKSSEVRIADEKINQSLGGTASGYIVAIAPQAEGIKTPEAMQYIDGLQRHLESLPEVGKTFSIADYVKRINRVLHDDNADFYNIPTDADTIAQYLFLFGMSAKQSDLDNVIDYPFQQANIWLQLKTWDADAMRNVIRAVEDYHSKNPINLEFKPAGTAYFNVVWNDEVLWDMLKGFILALVVVFILLAVNFKSIRWAIVGYIPLLFTIMMIYGVIGFSGKDFDMPISVLSCLSLGMAVDFSIHFISRLRQRVTETARTGETLAENLLWTAARPGKGIMRNAILFAAAFSVMMFAPLTPYITVGAFILSMMLVSALITLIYLPALILLFQRWLFEPSITDTSSPISASPPVGEHA